MCVGVCGCVWVCMGVVTKNAQKISTTTSDLPGSGECPENSGPLQLHLESTYMSLCAWIPPRYRGTLDILFCSFSYGQCLFLYVSLPFGYTLNTTEFQLVFADS